MVSNNSYDFYGTEWNNGCSFESLVSIGSSHEQAFVFSLLVDLHTDIWIGLTRGNADQFYWVNRAQVTCVYSSCSYAVNTVIKRTCMQVCFVGWRRTEF